MAKGVHINATEDRAGNHSFNYISHSTCLMTLFFCTVMHVAFDRKHFKYRDIVEEIRFCDEVQTVLHNLVYI